MVSLLLIRWIAIYPVDSAIHRLNNWGLVDKAFTNDWFNQTYDLNLENEEPTQLLEVATTNQLFQFDGQLYEQTDGVAMGSPLGPLIANVFMCHLEDKLARDGMVTSLYNRYVDDTLARMPMLLLTFCLH